MKNKFFYTGSKEENTKTEIEKLESKIKEIDKQLETSNSMALKLVRNTYKEQLHSLKANEFFK